MRLIYSLHWGARDGAMGSITSTASVAGVRRWLERETVKLKPGETLRVTVVDADEEPDYGRDVPDRA